MPRTDYLYLTENRFYLFAGELAGAFAAGRLAAGAGVAGFAVAVDAGLAPDVAFAGAAFALAVFAGVAAGVLVFAAAGVEAPAGRAPLSSFGLSTTFLAR